MTQGSLRKDLVILAADKDAEYALRGLLSRPQSLGIRAIEYDIYTHPDHDPGCRQRAHEFLRSFVARYAFALVVLDLEGSGRESTGRVALEVEMEAHLQSAGWPQRSAVVIIQPELEIWVWSDSPHVDEVLGWAGKQPDLRSWLRQRNLLEHGVFKPARPKEAMRAALRMATKANSPANFLQLASKVSFTRCSDPAFQKLLDTLRRWFAPNP